MFINPRQNLFNFKFSKEFMPLEIANKYIPYLRKSRGFPVKDPLDLLNYTIQGLSIPGLNTSPVEQPGPFTKKKFYRESKDGQDLYEKDLSITFRMLDGFLNYWMLRDIFNYYYSFTTREKFIDTQKLEILDGYGNVITSVKFSNILFTSIGELTFNFSSNVPESQTFDCSFTFNELDIEQLFEVST